MKIIALQAENIKKLVAIEIRPDGNVVEITGKNGQGKTSVLDSIWWALAGAGNVQTAPIRSGQQEARIALDLGELIVLRKFRRKDDGDITTSLVVESGDGARYPSPQKMLDALVGELSFDPLEFTRISPREQYDRLRQFVPGVDFDELDRQAQEAYDRRRSVNRQAHDLRSQAEGIEVPDGTPEQPVNEDELTDRLAEAAQHNADIERQQGKREDAAATAQRLDDEAGEHEREVAELRARAYELEGHATDKRDKAGELRDRLAAAAPLPDPVDTDRLRDELRQAREVNREVGALQHRRDLESQAGALEATAAKLTATIKDVEAVKQKAVREAKMPVDGLGFGDGEILLGEIPFSQASDAEQLEASVAIAMASNPDLRVIRVRDGSLLDEDAMAHLGRMADEHDCQVWIERVDSSGRVGFVLEDGHVRQADPA